MKHVTLESWEEFERKVSQLMEEHEARKKHSGLYVSDYLFRGQSDSAWPLVTTLERFMGGPPSLERYYRTLRATVPQVEAFTGANWKDLPLLDDYIKEIGREGLLPPGKFPAYEYFVHLRHFGFPSPLLDWTRSPYVAAYFAFRDTSEAANASIFAYCEYPEGHKSGSSNEPEIKGLGPYVRGHRRHFSQQSQYTVCTVFRDGKLHYASHEDAFAAAREDQDTLWKFDVPVSERKKTLRRLEQYNINAFSLFGSEESLMESLAIREILLTDRRD